MAELPETLVGASENQVLAGRYELLGLLGVGGMGTVYRARDRELDELVAVKMLRADLVEAPGMLARFRQEAKLARKVTHVNIARTFDIGEHEGAKFLTMEYVDGESLANVLERERRLPLGRVVDLVEPLCAGLSAAHAAGVIHRDLKPDNVLVAKDGRIVITDFGIARALTSDGRQTLGAAIGTPIYMAPEQVEGTTAIDARADIYALGAMMYELLTGAPPWNGDSAFAIAARRLVAPPPDPRQAFAEIPDGAARVVMRCMARKPEDRYASAAEVGAAFGSLTLAAGYVVQGPIAVRSAPPPAPSAPSVTGALHKTVAVLPFRNAGSPEDEYLADGLTEDLIDTLSVNRELRVRSRGAVMRYQATTGDPREIGRQLDVQVVAEGSVRRIGEMLRVTVRLVSVADGFQLWAKRFDRPAADILAVGDEAAAAIAQALAVDCHTSPRAAPASPVALDFFLRARHIFNRRALAATLEAVHLYEQALSHAPDDPTILAHYAIALGRAYAYGGDRAGASLGDKAREVAARAVALAPHLGATHLALATIQLYAGDPFVALLETRRTFAVAPMMPEAHELYGRLLMEIGEGERGIEHLRSSSRLDPTFTHVTYEIARALALRGEWAQCNEALAAIPLDPQLLVAYWSARMRVVMWQRDAAAAVECLRVLEADSFGFEPIVRAVLEVVATKRIGAKVLERLDALLASSRTVRRRAFLTQLQAEAFASADDGEATIGALERAASFDLFDIYWLDRCPLFDALRSDARFGAVRDRVSRRAAELSAALSAPI